MSDHALAGLLAPIDPRAGWDQPPFGTMATVTQLDDLVTRVVAPNPSHMTLDGTNTYLIGAARSGAAIVVDPGPDDADHRAAVDSALADRDAEAALVVVTHHHVDHAEAAQAWAAAFGCPVAATTPDVAGDGGRVVGDGDRLEAPGVTLDAVATPGHCADHVAYRLPSGAVLIGDHVLGRGTAVVGWPDGDLLAYLESLRRVLGLGADALYPGHGPELTQDAGAVVRYYLEHRLFREQQVLAVLADGPHDPPTVVRRIYADVDERLWPAAERSTLAALHKLAGEGRVAAVDESRWELTS